MENGERARPGAQWVALLRPTLRGEVTHRLMPARQSEFGAMARRTTARGLCSRKIHAQKVFTDETLLL